MSQHTVFSNLENKKLLSKDFQSIENQLRTETGQLVPFAGTGKVILTLNFKKLDLMEAYYQQQSLSPYFSGHYRQRGSGFGALAAGIGRGALSIARKFLCPVAKKIGRELIVQAAPELVEVVTKKNPPKQAIKSTVQKTVRKQVGGSKTGRMRKLKTNSEKPKQGICQKKPLRRSRSNLLSKVQNDY